MKKALIAGCVLMAGLAAFLLPGQEPPVKPPGKGTGKGGKKGPSAQPVEGAPFSAIEVTTTTQTMLDGNRIVRHSQRKVYRDSEGRERTEQEPTMSILGEQVSVATVMIADTVAGVTYNLDPSKNAARKIQGVRNSLASVANAVTPLVDRGSVSKEQLPPDTIEGVYAQGSRTTTTIPAGQVGNERDLNVVDEAWYSPDLQLNVMTRHNDPRSGETVYKLTNIVRAEPEASLFQVPAGYTVQDPPKAIIFTVTDRDGKTITSGVTVEPKQ
jgi:hypothetical protein